MQLFTARLSVILWAISGGAIGWFLQLLYTDLIGQAIRTLAAGPLLFIKNVISVDSNLVPAIVFGILAILVGPLTYVLIVRPIIRTHWLIPACVLGILSWVFIAGLVAPLGSSPFMLNWGPVTVSLLVGQLLWALPVGLLAERSLRQRT